MHAPLQEALRLLYERVKPLSDGAVADYIPELGRVDPDQFAIAITTVDGHQYSVGDAANEFTIQSISKPFVFGLALQDAGLTEVMRLVGVEPSGEAFNAISLEPDSGRPRNPMINAGAIATTSLVAGGAPVESFERILAALSAFAGRALSFDADVYESERITGHRNRAIAHLLRNAGILNDEAEGPLDTYFRQCSILVDCLALSTMAATLANGGANPISGERVIGYDDVSNVLSVMSTCGMYDYAGSWLYRVGIPAKSGVSGGIVAILPGQLGIGVFSPRLDQFGNSVRGVAVCEAFSREFGLHVLRPPVNPRSALLGAYTLADLRSQRRRTSGQSRQLMLLGGVVYIAKLQGPLVISTTEFILRLATKAQEASGTIVLDFHRVHSIDAASRQLIQLYIAQATGVGRDVVLTGLTEDLCDPAWLDPYSDNLFLFETLEEALEWCEDRILGLSGAQTSDDNLDPAKHSMLAQFADSDREAILPMLTAMRIAAGSRIVTQGEPPDALYLLASGTAAVTLQLSDGREHRIALLGPDTTFGEIALIDNEPRTANVDAVSDVVCYALNLSELQASPLGEAIRLRLIEQMAREMAMRLRRADAEIAALAL